MLELVQVNKLHNNDVFGEYKEDMMTTESKIVVEILFGTKGMITACEGCAGGSCCGSGSDYEKVSQEVAKGLEDEYGERIEVRYVDVDQVGLDQYPKVKNVLAVGYRYPITIVDGKPRLAGGVSLDQIKKVLAENAN